MIFIGMSSEFQRAIERLATATETIAATVVKFPAIGDKIVAQLDDLKAAIAAFGTQVSSDLSDLNTAFTSELTAIAAALGTQPPPTDLTDVIQSVNDLAASTDAGLKDTVTKINAETAALSGTPPTP